MQPLPRLVLTAILSAVSLWPLPGRTDPSLLEFRERPREGSVTVVYAGRQVRTYQNGPRAEAERAFMRPSGQADGGIFLLSLPTGGNACMPDIAVLDVGRTPPFASDVFGSCGSSSVMGRHDHVLGSIRSQGARPDRVWYYDRTASGIRYLPEISSMEHLRRAGAAVEAGNQREAIRHYLAVGELADTRAAMFLAAVLREGVEVERDDALARAFLARAADLGDPEAMAQLGTMISEGTGGPPGDLVLRDWTRLAAERGHGAAQLALARRLRAGEPMQSLVWFGVATRTLDSGPDAVAARSERESLAADMAAAEVEDATRRTAEFRPVAAGAPWTLPDDWELWRGKHPMERVRGGSIFDVPALAGALRPLLGAETYAALPGLSGPAGVSTRDGWVTVSGCRQHLCDAEGYSLAIRADGSEVVACVLRARPNTGPHEPGTLTLVRTRAPRRITEDAYRRGCPDSLTALLALINAPRRTGAEQAR